VVRVRSSLIVVAVFGIGLLSACSAKSRANEGKKGDAVPVVLAPVVQKTMPVRIQAVGNVEPYTTVSVKARVDGQIIETGFHEGGSVHKGQVLFQIDPRPIRALLAQAEANLARDKAQLEHAQAQDKRYQDLLKKHFISPDAYSQIHTNLQTAEATVRADQAAIDNAKVQLEYCTIRSPIEGRAGKIMIQQGNLVKANDVNPLVVINQVQPTYVTFAVPEQYLPAIRTNMSKGKLHVDVTVDDKNPKPESGELAFIDNTVDVTTGTIKVRATFPNADTTLWPGQFGTVILTLEQQPNAIVVPSQAVQTGPKGTYVFVAKPDMTAELRDVVVDRTEGAETVIAKGVSPGERVVSDGQLRVVPGAKLNPKQEKRVS
jgi:membrane fusion protein, multidrug efflux system